MAATIAYSPQPHWASPQFSPHFDGLMAGTPPTHPSQLHSSKPRTKAEVCSAFIEKLQARRNLDLTPELIEGIEQHFRLLPSRYALDVNISSLDVLNHKRLLDSARGDPSAVSFQVRPVDILSSPGNKAAIDRRPSFGNVESLLEVWQLQLAVCEFSSYDSYASPILQYPSYCRLLAIQELED